MWCKFLETKTLYGAETWKRLLNFEAIAVRIVPPPSQGSALTPREIWVPDSKAHVALEVLRKV